MIRYESQCVECPHEMGCIRESCPNWNVPVLICDQCGKEVPHLFDTDGGELCLECAKGELGPWDLEQAVWNTFNEVEVDG